MLADGDRFAVLCLNDIRAELTCADSIDLNNGMIATRSCPIDITRQWEEWLGTIASEELKTSRLFLVASRKSVNRDVIDQENALVEDNCQLYLLCMQIMGLSTVTQPRVVSGTWKSDGAPFRQVLAVRQPMCSPGAPLPAIDDAYLVEASELYISISKKLGNPFRWGRTVWAINCFSEACFASHPFERIHNFVRTIEGFLLPPQGKTKRTFKSRSELFIGPRHHHLIDLIYEVRSKIEHLNDPSRLLEQTDFIETDHGFNEIAWIIESIARHCLKRFLLTPSLEPYIGTDETISEFWRLTAADRRGLYGVPLEISQVRKAFDIELK